MRDLYDNGPLKDHLDCKNYIEKYFVSLTNGGHVYIEDGKIEMINNNNESMGIVYLERFEDEIKKWYNKKKAIPKRLICDINKPRSYTYRGNKNKTALYAKSIEGIGKSTLIDFFAKYVINPDLYAKELPVLNVGQWNLCDGKLKDMITGDELNYCDKYEKKIKAARSISNNYIIVTNHKALKRPDGRRYFIVDLNTEYQNDFTYFDKLHKTYNDIAASKKTLLCKDDDEDQEVIKQDLSVQPTLDDEQIEHYAKLLGDLKNKKLEELDNEMRLDR
eukprot:gene15653-21170_t